MFDNITSDCAGCEPEIWPVLPIEQKIAVCAKYAIQRSVEGAQKSENECGYFAGEKGCISPASVERGISRKGLTMGDGTRQGSSMAVAPWWSGKSRVISLVIEIISTRLEFFQPTYGGTMKTREFEKYAKNQLFINFSMLAVMISCAASIVVMLKSVV